MASTYAAGRRIVDIDAHILEPKGWLRSYAPATVKDLIPELGEGDPDFNRLLDDSYRDYLRRIDDENLQKEIDRDFMTIPRKGWMSLGGWDVEERRRALDLLGFDCQLVFPTGSFEHRVARFFGGRGKTFDLVNRPLAKDEWHDDLFVVNREVVDANLGNGLGVFDESRNSDTGHRERRDLSL